MEAVLKLAAAVLTLALGILIGVSSANAFGEVFRCTSLDGIKFNNDGTITPDNWLKKSPELHFLIDTSSGILRYGDSAGSQIKMNWRVIQDGSAVNDFVAVPLSPYHELELALGMEATAVIDSVANTAARESIRVRAWAEESVVTFRWNRLVDVVTGVCEEVH